MEPEVMSTDPSLQQPQPPPASWWPMAAIAMGQAQMSWNVNALPVSVGGISADFGVAPTMVVTAIVGYSLGVAGFTMLGARLGRRLGSLRVYRWMTVVFLAAMVLMTTSTRPAVMIAAQVLAGLASAAIIPALVVLTAQHYQGRQRATALGVLGAVQAIATVVAFFIAGVVGTYFGWRHSFGLLIPFSIGALLLSRHLAPVAPVPDVGLDRVGALLAAAAVILLSLGFDRLDDWGWMLSERDAPLSLLGLSPAPVMIVAGLLGVQFFIAWTQRREARGQMPLLALEIIESKPERAAIVAMMAMTIIGKSITFLIPLYMQIIQGSNSLQTAVAMIPYQLAVMAAAIMVVQLFARQTPRRIARLAFAVVIIGTLLLAITVRNDWSNLYVVFGLLLVGLGQGALSTLLFNVLVSASATELAGDVGALRGTVSNLASAVGTAVTGAFVVAVLAANIERALVDHPAIPPALISQVPLDNVRFVGNDQLLAVMSRTTATPEQVNAALEINAEARLRAMKLTFLLLTGLGMLAFVPAGRLPNYRSDAGPGGARGARAAIPPAAAGR
jgi:predicted MFS family arabinose efflux permease